MPCTRIILSIVYIVSRHLKPFVINGSDPLCAHFFLFKAVAGLSVVFTNYNGKNKTAYKSQQAGDRRSVIQATDNRQCYRQFFVGNVPPTGLQSNNNIRYICQMCGNPLTPCFSTMFNINYGIPLYSAYVVRRGQALNFGAAPRTGLNFRQEPGERQHIKI